MAYELNIRRGDTDLSGDAVAARMREALGEVAEGGRVWVLGGTRCILVDAVGEDTAVVGLDVSVPFGAVVDEVEACISRVLTTAAREKFLVFDPQLGRALGRGESAAALKGYETASEWHAEMTGHTEDRRQGIASAADSPAAKQAPMRLQVKILLGLIVVFVVAWAVFRSCVVSPMLDRLGGYEGEPPPDGPPPGWLLTHPPVLDGADGGLSEE